MCGAVGVTLSVTSGPERLAVVSCEQQMQLVVPH